MLFFMVQSGLKLVSRCCQGLPRLMPTSKPPFMRVTKLPFHPKISAVSTTVPVLHLFKGNLNLVLVTSSRCTVLKKSGYLYKANTSNGYVAQFYLYR